MANKSLFNTIRGSLLPRTDTTNAENAPAYKLSDEHALAQYVATGCLNGTFYHDAASQLSTILKLAQGVEATFIAKLAIHTRKEAFMKDSPALLCAILATRDLDVLKEVFPQVIDNGKMLRNFVQIVRSGVTGRKSLGSAVKRLVQDWLNAAADDQLLYASVGNDPSLADVIKMVHPKPNSAARDAYFGYLIGRPYDFDALPEKVKAFELWKSNPNSDLPKVPFQLLTAQPLNSKAWTQIAKDAPWQMTRMNLNTFARHGVFDTLGMAGIIAKRLKDPELVKRSRVFPYQLFAAYLNAGSEIPSKVTNALQDAMEIALANVPTLKGNVVICPDVSGSMHSPVTGYRAGSSSKVRCIDVAALVAAAILRKNPEATILPFENDVVRVKLNPRDAVMTNANKLASLPYGGTNCSAPLRWLNKHRADVDAVIFVSDNESWLDSPHYGYFGGGASATMNEWAKIKQRNRKAKMACIDITPHNTSQAKSRQDILNIGGFSDHVFKLLSHFLNGDLTDNHWVDEINRIPLTHKQKVS